MKFPQSFFTMSFLPSVLGLLLLLLATATQGKNQVLGPWEYILSWCSDTPAQYARTISGKRRQKCDQNEVRKGRIKKMWPKAGKRKENLCFCSLPFLVASGNCDANKQRRKEEIRGPFSLFPVSFLSLSLCLSVVCSPLDTSAFIPQWTMSGKKESSRTFFFLL